MQNLFETRPEKILADAERLSKLRRYGVSYHLMLDCSQRIRCQRDAKRSQRQDHI